MRIHHVSTMISGTNLLFTCSPSSMRLYWRRVSKHTRAKSSRMERNRSRFWFRSELNWTCEALQGNKNTTFRLWVAAKNEKLPILYWSCEILKGNQNVTVLRMRIRDPVLFDPWSGIRDKLFPDPGSKIPDSHSPTHNSESLVTIFWAKTKKYYNSLSTSSNYFPCQFKI